MKISELVRHIGDENIELQNIAGSLVRATVGKRDGEITFVADRQKVMALAGVAKQTYVGMIMWLPIDRLPESFGYGNPTPDREMKTLQDIWIPCKTALPPKGRIVQTKIDDAQGCRNEGPLKREGNLWFLPDGSIYVYYTPTHWKE